eukprot:scaffold84836_cov63-Phaeocystis_antarctica.AAC.2
MGVLGADLLYEGHQARRAQWLGPQLRGDRAVDAGAQQQDGRGSAFAREEVVKGASVGHRLVPRGRLVHKQQPHAPGHRRQHLCICTHPRANAHPPVHVNVHLCAPRELTPGTPRLVSTCRT